MIAGFAAVLLLGGCVAGAPAPIEDRRSPARVQDPREFYTVSPGDTLYSIAFRFGLDYRDLARINDIAPPYTIYPGGRILVRGAGERDAAPHAPARSPGKIAVAPAPPQGARPAPGQVIVRPAFPVASGSRSGGPVSSPPLTPEPVVRPAPVPSGEPAPAASSPSDAEAEVPVTPAPPAPQTTAPETTAPASSSPAPAVAPAAPPPVASAPPSGPVSRWQWPSNGRVSRSFSATVHKGIDIDGRRGEPVLAAAPGQVVYAGTGIVGFGELIIVKHDDIHLSAYGHNDRLLVREGDTVAAGQQIAEKGDSGTDSVKLHFEIRREGKPVDPLGLLPRR